MSDPVRTVLELLGIAARLYPDVARWLAAVADGDASAVDQVRSVLPAEGASAAFVREKGGG